MDAILKVCDDYEEGKTFYSEADANRWAEYSERVMTAPNTKKPVRRQMTISWLRPLKGLSSGDYQLLCSRAALRCGARRQQVYFEGYGRVHPSVTTLQDNAHRLKQRYAVRNVLRYLSIRSNITAWSWKEFLEYPLTPALANEQTVKFFTQQCSAEFTKRWCHPLGKAPKQMKAWEALISSVVSRHYEAVVAQGVGYEGSTWRRGTAQLWRWVTTVTRPGQHNYGDGLRR